MKVSLLMPCYNEEATLKKVVDNVQRTDFEKEIIICDNKSTDKSLKIAKALEKKYSNIKVVLEHERQGKGAAIRKALEKATGDAYVVFDCDEEYDPKDILLIIDEFEKGAKVVYGSRLRGQKAYGNKKHSYASYYLGGILLTTIFNLLNKSTLTDEATCLKCWHKDLRPLLTWDSDGFEWEPEITTKIMRKGYITEEVPIHYYPRTKEAGKKINWMDGVKGIWALIKYRWIYR